METARHQRELTTEMIWQAQKWAVKVGDQTAFSWALTLYLYTLEVWSDQDLKNLYAQAQVQAYKLEDLYVERERQAQYLTARA